MAREQFAYGSTKDLLATLDEAARRSGVSRGQAFEDFLHMTVCALSGGEMEGEYLQVVEKHSNGKRGRRGCDKLSELFGRVIAVMEETRQDVLGDLFQGAITYGEAGQFLTPDSITQLMAEMTLGEVGMERLESRTVCDPCCGSGRMLLAVADRQPHWEFIGQDVDLRCVRMTAINLALRNRYGYVIWGNSLGAEQKLIYRTGFNFHGFVRVLLPENCESHVQQIIVESPLAEQGTSELALPQQPRTQLRFF